MKLFGCLFAPFLLAFLIGVFFRSFVDIAYWLLFMLLLFAFACLCTQFARRSFHFIFFAVCLLGFTAGVFRFADWSDMPRDATLDAEVGSITVLTGVVGDEPDVREGKTHLTIALHEAGHGNTAQAVSGRMLAIVSRYPEYHYGDVLELRGKFDHPKAFAGRDGRIFDYPTYLATKGIHYQMLYPNVVKKEEGKGNIVFASLFFVKKKFTDALALALPEPHNALSGGLLLGGKQSLGEVWLDRFRTTGVVHIVVLSGYNMTIVAEWLVVIFRSLGFFGSLSAGGIGIVLFAIMTGGGATVLRAAIMAIFVLLAKATGRTYTMGRALLIAGALMVLHNPSILAFDPSFQLSFLASLGLVFVSPIIEHKIKLFKNSLTFREVLISTLATQLAVLPLLLYQTGMLSLVALPTNLLILPLIPLTMFLGFIAGAVTLVLPSLGFIVALPAYVSLSWILGITKFAAGVPHAAVGVTIGPIAVFILYALLLLWIWRAHQGHLLSSMSDRKQEQ